MNEEKVLSGIRDAMGSVTPDIREPLLAELEAEKARKSSNIVEFSSAGSKRRFTPAKFAAIAAALLLAVGAFFAVRSAVGKDLPAAVASVMIDVNPSIELSVGGDGRVVSATPRNDDGAAVLGDMRLEGSDVSVAVNAVIGAMLRSGYINELANSVLISVEGSDEEACLLLRETLCTEVREQLDGNSFGYAVLGQEIDEAEAVTELAASYGVSAGKAQLIKRLIASNPAYDFKSLAALSINELGLLSSGNAVEKVHSYGHSSDRAFIGSEAAAAAAYAHAGLDADYIANYVTLTSVKLDCEGGKMVYEVEFSTGREEWEYEINAVTGEVIKGEKEYNTPTPPSETTAPRNGAISADEAIEAALYAAGIARSEARNIEVELDRENGRLIYEVEFTAKGLEYECEIDAATGAVIKIETEEDDHSPHATARPTARPTAKPTQQPSPTAAPTSSPYIGRSAALRIALEDAGVSADSARNIEVELEKKHGKMVYEVEFDCSGMEYDYLINAKTGAIEDKHTEHEHDGHSGDPGVTLIGEARAWEIALERAGLSSGSVTGKELELERDNGVYVYELEFKSGGCEYEVKINAVSGAILKFEKERD